MPPVTRRAVGGGRGWPFASEGSTPNKSNGGEALTTKLPRTQGLLYLARYTTPSTPGPAYTRSSCDLAKITAVPFSPSPLRLNLTYRTILVSLKYFYLALNPGSDCRWPAITSSLEPCSGDTIELAPAELLFLAAGPEPTTPRAPLQHLYGLPRDQTGPSIPGWDVANAVNRILSERTSLARVSAMRPQYICIYCKVPSYGMIPSKINSCELKTCRIILYL